MSLYTGAHYAFNTLLCNMHCTLVHCLKLKLLFGKIPDLWEENISYEIAELSVLQFNLFRSMTTTTRQNVKWLGLVAELGICSFAHSLIAHSLICSNQMSDCERFAQITQGKWANVSKLLWSLKTNERPWANRSGRAWQMRDSLRSLMINERMSNLLKIFWLKNLKSFF